MEKLLGSKGRWKCTQVLIQDFMTTLGPSLSKERRDLSTKHLKLFRVSLTQRDNISNEASLLPEVSNRNQEILIQVYFLTFFYNIEVEEVLLISIVTSSQ